ncbi:MAG: DUF4080 domain-containing protein [Clostridia bacterium]|nr:DUF4080 domain-containing protein [Clostridia bacterium]
MKVILGCLNAKYIHMSSAPWCLAAGVRAYGPKEADCKVMEATINGDLDGFADEIIKRSPDVVTFSCYIWNIRQTLELCRKIKAACPCIIALGGPEVAYRAEALLKQEPLIDYILSGEGEFAFPPFLRMLIEKGDPAAVEGLAYRKAGAVLSVPEGVYTADPPSPYDEAYFEALQGRICYIETSRGCPYRCAFCLSGRLAPYRIFSDKERIRKDLLKLSQSGSKTIKFVDRTFNANEEHANFILSFILENYGSAIPNGVCFHFEMGGDILRESTLSLLEKMPKGAVQLEIGMQSFHAPTLEAICRRTNVERLKSNIKRLLSFGNMHIHIDLIAGLKEEGMAEFEKSFNTAFSLRAHMLQMGFLKLLYGAPMREKPEEYPCQFNEEPPYEVRSTPWLSEEELVGLKKCEDALDRLYNSGHFLYTVDYLLETLKIAPFSLFSRVGEAICGKGISLGQYAEELYDYFAPLCDAALLQEKLVMDLLCSASASQIPKTLRLSDPRHKKVAAYLAAGEHKKVAILEKSQKVLLVDPQSKRDLWGRFDHQFFELESILENL